MSSKFFFFTAAAADPARARTAIGLGHRPKCSTTALARSLKTSVRGQDAQHTIRRSPDAQSNCHQEMNESPRGSAVAAFNWGMVTRSLAQPYRVPVSMILLFALVPLYVLIPEFFPPRTRHVPELALDRAWPLVPSWAIVYGALYLFLILLPIFVIRQDQLIRRTVYGYLLIWITAYVFFFVVYPTAAPRPDRVTGEGFAVWGLRALYSSTPPVQLFSVAPCRAFSRVRARVFPCASSAWSHRHHRGDARRCLDAVHEAALRGGCGRGRLRPSSPTASFCAGTPPTRFPSSTGGSPLPLPCASAQSSLSALPARGWPISGAARLNSHSDREAPSRVRRGACRPTTGCRGWSTTRPAAERRERAEGPSPTGAAPMSN